MSEIVTGVFGLFGVILGAACTYLAGLFQWKAQEATQKKLLLSEKLERAYQLCQLAFEGHRREINSARKNLPQDLSGFINARNHPGNEMSELRMLIQIYANDLSIKLEDFGTIHSSLKKSFRDIDAKALEMKMMNPTELEQEYTKWKHELELLGDASSCLKIAIAEKASALTK